MCTWHQGFLSNTCMHITHKKKRLGLQLIKHENFAFYNSQSKALCSHSFLNFVAIGSGSAVLLEVSWLLVKRRIEKLLAEQARERSNSIFFFTIRNIHTWFDYVNSNHTTCDYEYYKAPSIINSSWICWVAGGQSSFKVDVC